MLVAIIGTRVGSGRRLCIRNLVAGTFRLIAVAAASGLLRGSTLAAAISFDLSLLFGNLECFLECFGGVAILLSFHVNDGFVVEHGDHDGSRRQPASSQVEFSMRLGRHNVNFGQ